MLIEASSHSLLFCHIIIFQLSRRRVVKLQCLRAVTLDHLLDLLRSAALANLLSHPVSLAMILSFFYFFWQMKSFIMILLTTHLS